MRIDHPSPEPYQVEDFDFSFSNGLLLSFSVAKGLGDTVDFDTAPLAVKFHFSEKPSPTNADAKLPEEEITVLMQHVLTVAKRVRMVTPPTQEERDLFKRVLHKIPTTVQ